MDTYKTFIIVTNKNVKKITLGFTILELTIIMLLLSILIYSFRNQLKLKSESIVYWQICVEKLYGEINNFVWWAARSKGILSWSETIFPDIYMVQILPSTNQIHLQYNNSGVINTYQTYELTGIIPAQRYCKSPKYDIILSWADSFLFINRWLEKDSNLQSFWLSGLQTFRAETNIFLYEKWQSTGKLIGQLNINKQTQSIQKRNCLYINTTGGNCEEWDK